MLGRKGRKGGDVKATYDNAHWSPPAAASRSLSLDQEQSYVVVLTVSEVEKPK